MIFFEFICWLQEVFDVLFVFMLMDDEKVFFNEKLIFEIVFEFVMENVCDIIVFGFDVKKIFLYSDFKYVLNYILMNVWEFFKYIFFN